MSESPDRLLLSAVETAALLNISRTSLYALHSSGRLPLPVKLGRRTLWNLEEMKNWTAAGCPARQKWESIKGNLK